MKTVYINLKDVIQKGVGWGSELGV